MFGAIFLQVHCLANLKATLVSIDAYVYVRGECYFFILLIYLSSYTLHSNQIMSQRIHELCRRFNLRGDL